MTLSVRVRPKSMTWVKRQDRLLVAGLALAVPIVVFARPIERWALGLARDAEQNTGFALLPAHVVLILVFFFHQLGKRLEEKTRAAAAEASALQAQARASEMERLVAFGQALARALDVETIRDVVQQHLSKLAGTDEAWILLRVGAHWQALAGTAKESRRDIERAQSDRYRRASVPSAHGRRGHRRRPRHSRGGRTVSRSASADARHRRRSARDRPAQRADVSGIEREQPA